MTQIDQVVDIREGEELDISAVDQFMKQAIPGLEGQPGIKQYPGGASNLTYQVDYGEQSYVLRRPPFGKIAKSAHDMLREARVMEALKPVYPYVPNIVDRKSTRLNSSHVRISYAVFCLKKKKQ